MMSVPQRQSKVMKGFGLLRDHQEFKMIHVKESEVLDQPWIIGSFNNIILSMNNVRV